MIELMLMDMNVEILSFLPLSVVRLAAGCSGRYVIEKGTVLFADVAGFTPLTEALLVLGREGSEELTRILNHHFSSMIEITDSYGGDVLRFAGDAMTVFFPDDDGSAAVSCGLAMLEKMKEYSKVESRAGEFELAMKIGCASGDVQIGVVGPEGEADYYALGEPLDASADAEHHAQRGDLVVSPTLSVPRAFETTGRGEGFFLVTGIPLSPSSRKTAASKAEEFDPSVFLPHYMIDQAQPGVRGEHRGTTVIFLSFPPPGGSKDAIHSGLSRFYEKTLSIVKKYGGILNKLDFGDKGAKAVILFGAPVACENKEEMAVRAALDIMSLEENRGLLRMGITSSHLFSGPLGSLSRREFTVMGDGINLSARLMGYAKPGEIITDRSTYEKSLNSVAFRERGDISVKGKSGLIKIFEPISVREETRETEGKKLFGREAVQQEIKEWLLSPEKVPLAVLGEPGSGKSAMADWLFREAKAREYNVQKIELQPFSRDVFFSLFARLLKKIFQIESAEELSKLIPLIPAVSREFSALLLPYFGYEETEDRTLENLGPKDRRDIAYSMLLTLFENIDDTVFIIDNLSFADQASLDFLSYAINNSEKKLLDVAAFSRMEITGSGTFEIFRRVVELPPLDMEHLRQFISEEFGIRSASDPVLKFLEDKSKGNPRLINALVSSMKGEGLIAEKDGVSYVDEDRLFRTQFPDSLEAVYLKEFDKLEVRQKQMLFEASVFGTNVSVNLLDKLSSFREDQIREMYTELSGKGFIRIDESGKRPYLVFSDTLLYEAIYNLAPYSLKRDLHKSIFNKLLDIEGDKKPSLYPYLAHHSEKAGDRDNAIKFHRLAGRDFLLKYDNIGALKHLDNVFYNDTPSPDYFEDAFRLLDILLSIGKFSEAKGHIRELWKKIDDTSPQLLSSLYNFDSEVNMREGETAKSEENLKTSLRIAEKNDNVPGIARALINLVGRIYGPSGKYEKGRKALERLLALPHFKGDAVFRVVALMNLGSIYRHQLNFKSSGNYYKKSLHIARQAKLLPRQTAIISNLIQLCYETNSYKKALAYSLKGIHLASTFSQRELFLDISIHHALSMWAIGKTRDSAAIASNIKEKAVLFSSSYSQAMSNVILGVAQFDELLFRESLENLRNSIDQFEAISCSFDANSSKLEYLRLLKFIGFDTLFANSVKSWGGREKLLKEALELHHSEGLTSILIEKPLPTGLSIKGPDVTSLDKTTEKARTIGGFDPDSYFVYWLKDKRSVMLEAWLDGLKRMETGLRYDLKVKWTWAYLSKDLEPPFDPMRLLSKSPGGIFGLRILAILWRHSFEAEKRRRAKKIRKRLLEHLYFAKIHSDDQIWECIIKDSDIAQAIKGRIIRKMPAIPPKKQAGQKPAYHSNSRKKGS